MDQRALERDPLPHAAREAGHRIVGAGVEAGPLQRRVARRAAGSRTPWRPAKNSRFSRARELRIEEEVVAEHADARAQRRALRVAAASP